MRFSDAKQLFSARAAAGTVINRKTGQSRTLSDSRLRVIVSNVRTALAAASGLPAEAVDACELGPYVASLAEIGRATAVSRGKDDPRNVAANITLFLAALYGEYEESSRHGYARRRPVTRERVLPDWLPLYDTLVALADEEPTKRTFSSQLVHFQDLALRNGVRTPRGVPDDFVTVSSWAQSAGIKSNKFQAMAAAFRTARLRLGDLSLATFYQRVNTSDRGLRGLPDLTERLHAAGCQADPLTVPTVDIVRFLAPKLGPALDRHLDEGRRRHRSPGWVEEQVGMASRFIAELIRQGYDPAPLTWVDLFEQTVVVEGSSEGDDMLAEVLGSDYTAVEHMSLFRSIVESAARESAARSPLTLIETEGIRRDGEVPFYTLKVRQDAMYAFMLTNAIYGAAMQKADRDRWLRIAAEYDIVRQQIAERTDASRTRGHLDKSRILLLWPQAVCIGLHALRQRVLAVEARKDAFYARRGHFDTTTGRRILKEFDEVLKEYVLTAVLLDDGLRIKNYAGAMAGEHLKPEVVRDRSDRWVAFRRMETSFRGFDTPEVSLKVARDVREAERCRTRLLTPGVVDHRLLYIYWTESRPRDLVRRGTLRSVEQFSPDTDHFAVFIAPRAGGRRKIRRSPVDERRRRSGQYTPDQLSKIIGRVLHWMVRDVLGRDVPAWDDPVRTKEWRGVFAAHVTRTLLATYFGGIRKDWVYACEVTDDTEITLRRNYVKIRSAVVARLREAGPENPHHFDAVIDRMRAGRDGDDWDAFWAAFDPNEPTLALEALEGVRRLPENRTVRQRSTRWTATA